MQITEQEPDSGYLRLEQQIIWYDSKSNSAKRYYKWIKFVEFSFAGLVTYMANVNPNITAVLGAGIIILEGLQQINQWSHNWITYRSTCEALRHEKYVYLGSSGIYSDKTADEAKKIFVDRVESLISSEHAKWTTRQEYGIKRSRDS